MARNKHPQETINRILDVSLKLFTEKGYEKTTIQDIIENLEGLSRGAIYHHFKSKEEIIDKVIMRMYQDHNLFNKIKNDHSLNGLEKIKKIFLDSITSIEHQELYHSFPTLMKNPKFLSRQLNQSILGYAPQLKEIIEEGINDGSIHCHNSKELSEVFMILVNIWLNPAVFTVTKEEFTDKINFLKILFEGIGLAIIDNDIEDALNNFRYEVESE